MNLLTEWNERGGEVSVAGLARSGSAAVRLLAARGIRVYASDGNAELQDVATDLMTEFPEMVTAEAGRHDQARIAQSMALVLSPGIPPDANVATSARSAGVPIVAEARVGLDAMPGVPWVAVTGTNGKSTTTALIAHLLNAAGCDAMAVGNIGTAVSEAAIREPRPDWLAVELSSFQLHDAGELLPTVGVLTNLSADHLDRYLTLEDYYADKKLLLEAAVARSIWISNLDDADSRVMMQGVKGRHLAFSTIRSADAWYDRKAGVLMLAGQRLLPRAELPLAGDHNVANALAAVLALHAAGIAAADLAAGLVTFTGLPHRLEPVGEFDGVLWINDSKATTVASTEVALQAMTRPYVLLLGGRHKGAPYTPLIHSLKPLAQTVIAFGEAGDQIEADLGNAVPVVRAGSFADVMAKARELSKPGGAVLLSPACSSYDMFVSYDDRGKQFRAAVMAL
jgi:UDP-N-acetylmuramoylalanine--D-glutamate ligase